MRVERRRGRRGRRGHVGVRAGIRLRRLDPRAGAWLDEHPILLCPAAATPAFELGYDEPDVFDLFHHCKLASAVGLPAAVVPVATSPEGLPVGVQIVGRRGREDEVLAAARAIAGTGPAAA